MCRGDNPETKPETKMTIYTDSETKSAITPDLLSNASSITVCDDGQFRYPVLTAEMEAWVAAHGEITASNYQQFCDAVDMLAQHVGSPGTPAMIDLCAALLDAGANFASL